MTYEEAKNLLVFDEPCTCGGYAWTMNGRDPNNPHMAWCPQREQYMEWKKAMNNGKT